MTKISRPKAEMHGADAGKENSGLVDAIEEYKSRRGGAHRAGTLTRWPLKQIQYYLENYFAGKDIRTAETGCGASTILFSKYAYQHTAYCYDDRQSENSSVEFARSCPLFVPDRVAWSFGPTQQTLRQSPPKEPLDMLLIDGPHGYPFPEFEYLTFWPLLKPGAILVLDDIHIPTIGNMYRFLCEDDMFYPVGLVANTAFFQRTDAPAFDATSDGWWTQRYNVQRFSESKGHTPKLEIPFSLDLASGAGIREEWLRRGFYKQDGDTITDGTVAIMQLPLSRPLAGKVRVDLDFEGVGLDQRPHAQFQIAIDAQSFPAESFRGEGRNQVSYVVEPADSEILTIKFHSYGLVDADAIPDFTAAKFDKRLPGLIIRSIAVRPEEKPEYRWEQISQRDGSIVTFRYDDIRFRFFVDQPGDSIQAHHAAGQFYEREELELIRAHVQPGARILDVGANIGNHTIYFERVLGAKLVVPIEPCPRAVELLRLNALLNNLARTDMRYLGIALSNEAGLGDFQEDDAFNLGGTSVRPGGARKVMMLRGDSLFKGQVFDFIKIDVEGREIEVLEGLAQINVESSPAVFIEVWDKNKGRFADLISALRYEIVAEYRRYETMTNFMILPKDRGTK